VHNWLCEKIGALHAAYAQSVRNLRCEAVKAAPIPSPHLQLSWSNRWSNEVCSPFAGHQLSSKNQQLANSLPQELAIHDPGGHFGCFPPIRLLQFRAASPLSLTLLSCKMKTAAQLEAEAVEAAGCRCQCNSSSQTGTVWYWYIRYTRIYVVYTRSADWTICNQQLPIAISHHSLMAGKDGAARSKVNLVARPSHYLLRISGGERGAFIELVEQILINLIQQFKIFLLFQLLQHAFKVKLRNFWVFKKLI